MADCSKHLTSMRIKCNYIIFTSYRLGDQIASVNDNTLLNVTHADAVKILKDSDHDIELVSMFPCDVRRRYVWW